MVVGRFLLFDALSFAAFCLLFVVVIRCVLCVCVPRLLVCFLFMLLLVDLSLRVVRCLSYLV